MGTGNDKTAGAKPALVDLLRGLERKHHHPPNPAGPARSLPQAANRQIELVGLARLTARKTNARRHSPKQIGQIAESIKRFGFIVPVLVNADNQVVAGHGRLEAAKWLGLVEVPVLRVSHLSPAEQRAFVIADNRLAELAEWDHNTLAIELQALIELDFAVEVIGFDMAEIELILHVDKEDDQGGTEKTGAEAKTANARCGPAVSRCGDVWLLGAHQLSCGDAADEAGYAAVDAAIRRWQNSTGSSATLAGFGQTFKATAQKRRKQAPPRGASKPAAVAPSAETA
jgi:ParB-like chromosome segregation protein Spo0J